MLYFDHAATTSLAAEVLAAMLEVLQHEALFANPSSEQHAWGKCAAARVDYERAQVAQALGCEPEEVLFTSGATEANNLALAGIARAYRKHGRHILTSAIEHKSILASCAALEREGFSVSYLKPNADGQIEPHTIAAALRDDTLLVSLQQVNNETGVIQPLAEVAAVCAERGVLLHVDAAQSAGKLALDLSQLPIDLLSLSAHKFHGPKGSGVLVVRNRRQLRMQPLLYGGGQEFGLRSGTLALHQIVGLSHALRLALAQREHAWAWVSALKRHFIDQLTAQLPLRIHGALECSSPYIINFSLPGISSSILLSQLADTLALSSGSACSSGAIDPSYVIRAMGVEGDALYGAVRMSFSREQDQAQVTAAVAAIVAAVRRIQELA